MTRTSPQIFLLTLVLAATAAARQGGASQAGQAKSPPPVEAVAEARAPAGWKRYRFGSPALFTALLPSPPAVLPNQSPREAGDAWSWGFYSSGETAVYVLTYSLYSPAESAPKTERERRVAYNNFAAGFADGLLRGGRDKFGADARAGVIAERRVRVGGVEAFERELTLGDQYSGRLLTAFAGEHSLTATAVWLNDSPATERAAFFDSLTLDMARGAAPADPLAGWRRYEPADGSFSVMLPVDPAVEVQPETANPPGGRYYRAVNEDHFYVIAHVPRGVPVRAGQPPAAAEFFYEQIFKAVIEKLRRDMMRQGIGDELTPGPRRAVTVGGLPGREQTFTIGGGVVEVRLQAAIAGEGFFSVLAMWPLEVPPATREAFLKSFKIVPPRPAPAGRR